MNAVFLSDLAVCAVITLAIIALGKWILGERSPFGECLAMGSIAIAVSVYLMGCMKEMTTANLYGFKLILCCATAFTAIKTSWSLIKWLIDIHQSMSKIGRFCLYLLVALLFARVFRAWLPNLGWDTLGYQLTLSKEYLLSGSLEPLYHVPVDRRVPIGGVLPKIFWLSGDEYGRLLIMFNLFLYIGCLNLVYRIASKILKPEQSMIPVFGFACITDIAVHVCSAGDEIFLALLVLCILHRAISSLRIEIPKRVQWSIWIMIGWCVTIKITAFFWVPILVLIWLWGNRNSKITCVIGLVLSMIIALYPHYHLYKNYHMLFPFSRWTDLMQVQKDDPPKIYKAEEVRSDRALLGLGNDQNDKSIAHSPAILWGDNLITFIGLPLGPFLWWFIPIAFLYRRFSSHGDLAFWLKPMLLTTIVALSLSFLAWHFTAPALFRYHLPSWVIGIPAILIFISFWAEEKQMLSHLWILIGVYALFSLALEGKQILKLSKSKNIILAQEYWFSHALDGPLIKRVAELNTSASSIFYIGPCSALLDLNHRPYYAQIGNEVGWRKPKEWLEFLEARKIKYWVISSSTTRLDSSYEAITDLFILQNRLELVDNIKQGKIYSVLPPN